MIEMTSYDSLDDMFDAIANSVKAANENLDTWQSAIKIGDCFLRDEGELLIWGEVIDPTKNIETGAVEYEEDAKLYEEPHMRGFRFTKCYSEWVPEGEYGDTHMSNVLTTISKQGWEWGKSRNWPTFTQNRLAVMWLVRNDWPDITSDAIDYMNDHDWPNISLAWFRGECEG